MDPFLKRALDEIDRSATGLGVDVLARPAGTRWSIAEILEHLTLAFSANRTALEKALASGELRARRPTARERIARVVVIDVGYFPRRGAPEATRPRGSIAHDRAVDAIREALVALDTTLSRVAERFGETAAVANHPYFAGLTVGQWRRFHWRHTVHHMRQVRTRARRSPEGGGHRAST